MFSDYLLPTHSRSRHQTMQQACAHKNTQAHTSTHTQAHTYTVTAAHASTSDATNLRLRQSRGTAVHIPCVSMCKCTHTSRQHTYMSTKHSQRLRGTSEEWKPKIGRGDWGNLLISTATSKCKVNHVAATQYRIHICINNKICERLERELTCSRLFCRFGKETGKQDLHFGLSQ